MPEHKGTDATRLPSPAQPRPTSASLSSRTKVDLGAFTHRGNVRPNNEDSFLVTRFKRSLCTLLTNLPAGQFPEPYGEVGYVMLVADGIGGAAAGQVASRTAISSLVDIVIQTPDWIMSSDGERVGEVLRRMEERFGQLTDALTKRAQSDLNLSGMGTTLTLAASLGADLVIGHVGDSRAYLFRQGQLLHLTSDQTVAQVLADAGVIRPEDVAKHHARHVLTSAITASDVKAEVELHHMRLMDGDQLLLCSNGLTEMVTDASIMAVLERPGSALHACRELVDLALKAGGRDNVTVVLGRYGIPGE
jgi:serine/threonine protein phosphatase PrpC